MTLRLIGRRAALGTLGGAALGAVLPGLASSHGSEGPAERLPTIGEAADFTLTGSDGKPFTFSSLKGRVVALGFIFTQCADVCPLLVDRLVGIAEALGEDFGGKASFVLVTVDPERDTPDALADYAANMGAEGPSWHFLTGTKDQIRGVASRYGVFYADSPDETVSHNLLTSIIDGDGRIRVQYLGHQFDPDEFKHDLRDLIAEEGSA